MTTKRFYLPIETQVRSAVKPAEHYGRFRSERRLRFWRALAMIGIAAALAFIALALRAFLGWAK